MRGEYYDGFWRSWWSPVRPLAAVRFDLWISVENLGILVISRPLAFFHSSISTEKSPMNLRNPLGLNRSLSFVLQAGHSGTSSPYAARISITRLSTYLVGTAVVVAVMAMGTLLFFRELETNRKLQERLWRLEAEKRLYQSYPLPERLLAAAPTAPATAAPVDKTAAADKAKADAAGEVVARINDLRAECAEDNCSIRLGMVTAQPGTAVGQLLLVLETEVPRIGGSNPTAPVRKRFFLYPGNNARDELDPNALATLDQKPFRFNRTLQTNTVFKMGKLLRPLAVNAYIFDAQKAIIQHERKVIESEEP